MSSARKRYAIPGHEGDLCHRTNDYENRNEILKGVRKYAMYKMFDTAAVASGRITVSSQTEVVVSCRVGCRGEMSSMSLRHGRAD